MNSRRGPEIPISASPQQCPRPSQSFASARNRAICGWGDSQARTPAGRRGRSISGSRFRRKPLSKTRDGGVRRLAAGIQWAPPRPPDEIPKSRFTEPANSVSGNRSFSRRPEIGQRVGGATLRRRPPRVAAIGQFSGPVFAGNPTETSGNAPPESKWPPLPPMNSR